MPPKLKSKVCALAVSVGQCDGAEFRLDLPNTTLLTKGHLEHQVRAALWLGLYELLFSDSGGRHAEFRHRPDQQKLQHTDQR